MYYHNLKQLHIPNTYKTFSCQLSLPEHTDHSAKPPAWHLNIPPLWNYFESHVSMEFWGAKIHLSAPADCGEKSR
jgi:hypothetical protein